MGVVQRVEGGQEQEAPDLLDAVRASVRSFAKTRPTQQDAAAVADEWQQIAAAGWLGLLADETLGGSAMSTEVMAALYEELGRAGVTTPYSAVAVLALVALDQCTPGVVRDELLAALSAGTACPVLCWQDQPNRDERTLPFETLSHERTGTIAFRRCLIDLADRATHFCVPVDRDGTPGLAVIARSDPCLTLTLVPGLADRPLGQIEFSGAIPADAFLPLPDREALAPAFLFARIAAAAQLSGLCAQINAMTVDFTGQRVQFGKPIAANQVVQHRLVDLWTEQTLAAAAVAHAARSCADGRDAALLATLAAKARAGKAADVVTRGAFQLHGAIGYTGEYPLGGLVRGCLALMSWLGTAHELRRRFVAIERTRGAVA